MDFFPVIHSWSFVHQSSIFRVVDVLCAVSYTVAEDEWIFPVCYGFFFCAIVCILYIYSSLSDSLNDYIVPRTNRKLGERAFSVAAPKAWNRLPTKLKTSTCSTDSFKRSLKTFLFQSAYGCETRVS